MKHESHYHDKALPNEDSHPYKCLSHTNMPEIDEAADVDGRRARGFCYFHTDIGHPRDAHNWVGSIRDC